MAAKKQQSRQLAPQKDLIQGLKGALVRRENAQMFAELVPATMGKVLTPERICTIVLGAASRNPTLLECTTASVIKAVAELVGLGLEPGSLLGEGYLVPFRNSKLGAMEVQAIPGYRGYLALARRSGVVAKVVANIVCSNDRFSMDLTGFERPTHFLPEDLGDRGHPLAAYCIASLTNGEFQPEYMSIGQIEDVRARSKARDSGPWVTDWGQMARKTVIRRAAHYWPLSIEIARALDLDNRNDGSVVDARTPLQQAPAPLRSASFSLAAAPEPEEPPPFEPAPAPELPVDRVRRGIAQATTVAELQAATVAAHELSPADRDTVTELWRHKLQEIDDATAAAAQAQPDAQRSFENDIRAADAKREAVREVE